MKHIRNTAIAALAALALSTGSAQAAGGAPTPPSQDWTFDGLFGHFEEAQLKRGYQVFVDVCNGCHSLDLIFYRNLEDIGFSEDDVKEIAAGFEVKAGPDEEGEVLEDGEFIMRPALPTDRFNNPFPNPQAAMSSNSGALPPDLSLITKARKKGPDYLYALLTGYKDEAPEGVEIPEDKYYNEYYPGHAITMAPPIDDESVEYEDGTEPTLENHAKDLVTFLAWAAEPELEDRKAMGIKVLLFLIVLTAMLYALKRQIWSRVH